MRAGPLSDSKVIEKLNRFFVPVYVSNEDYGKNGAASGEEKKELQRIYHAALKEKRSAGSVCVYLLDADGKGFASMIVSDAAQTPKMHKLLDAAIALHQPKGGAPVAAPVKQSVPPSAGKGEVVLHLVSRVAHRYSWGEFPSENWIVLSEKESQSFVAEAQVRVGGRWAVDRKLAAKILTHFYPQTETCDFGRDTDENGPHKHRIEDLDLDARILATKSGVVHVRLDGSVRIKHTFYPDRDDKNEADAKVAGYAEFDLNGRRLLTLRLVTTEATYGRFKFDVAVQSAP